MATLTNAFQINGVVDTKQSVLANLNTLCTSSGCWLSYDVNTGLWSVVINRAGTSVKSFDDSNIIGNINISGSGINELYNAVSIEFPHKDLRDQTDYIDLEIPAADRFPNEIDNTLNIKLQTVNDPVAAQYIASVELKQSRVDKIIEFRSDYTALGLKAGDIIDITSDVYGYTNKEFRITKIVESDPGDGSIQLSITALEYDADVYDDSNLVRIERTKKTGIVPKASNTALTQADTYNDLVNAARGNVYDFSSAIIILDTTDVLLKPYPLGYSFVIEYSGYYSLEYNINWAGVPSLPKPPLGIFKRSGVLFELDGVVYGGAQSASELPVSSGTNVNVIMDGCETGGQYEPAYQPHNLTGIFYATAGQTITFFCAGSSDYIDSYPYYHDAAYPYFVPNASDVSGFSIIGNLRFIGL